jgi:hypothetical protein
MMATSPSGVGAGDDELEGRFVTLLVVACGIQLPSWL